jgi:polysaccharide chain length determinant protein (PEP-CTERM system associated)
MPSSIGSLGGAQPNRAGMGSGQISLEHYVGLLLHRKWLIITTFLVVTVGTVVVVAKLPNIYTSETLILVDPQKVPEAYVSPTVSGDVRSRLSTLEQQILSATRLQKIIDSLKLYPELRGKMAREEIITMMRKEVQITLVSDVNKPDILQAFKISYSGKEPRLVARVVTELAGLFINENLKVREQQVTGTTEFLESQLRETRKTLEEHEAKLRDFRLSHIGEMPEQEGANLQILGQLQSQLHLAGEALARAEQQRSVTEAILSQSVPTVMDFDDQEVNTKPSAEGRDTKGARPAPIPQSAQKTMLLAQLNEKLSRGYTESHPDIRRLRAQLVDQEAKEPKIAETRVEAKPRPDPNQEPVATPASAAAQPRRNPAVVAPTANPVLVTQIKALDNDIEKNREEQQRLEQEISVYQKKLEAIPIREQQMTELVRDYEISKAHYAQLLDKQLSAETATQLEIRQKGEKFSILDPAQPAERPSKPKRKILDLAGSLAGLVLGMVLALSTEIRGPSITEPGQLASIGIPVLETIPVIETQIDQRRRKKRLAWAVSGGVIMLLACCLGLFYRHDVSAFFYRYGVF